ncbi:MAG TPA: TIGR02147 family protein, partial [Myxococcota bacterium]|nr:TIGR02147 family protein [Myxococcota bacterium]
MDGAEIYRYLDYRKFLADWFREKKEANPLFSHRAFARKAGQASPSLLLHVIEGKRNLTPITLEAFVKALGLKSEEVEFFTTLVNLDQAETQEEQGCFHNLGLK